MVVLFDFSASQENYMEDKSESLCPTQVRKQCSFATQHVKRKLRPENTGFKKEKTWMGKFPDLVIWQKSQMKSRGFPSKEQ